MSDNNNKEFYIAVILLVSTSESGNKEPLYQENFVLLEASGDEEARNAALEHARRSCIRYENAEGETIQWSLKHIVDVNRVLAEELKHGADLYARHFTNYDAYYNFEPLLGGSSG